MYSIQEDNGCSLQTSKGFDMRIHSDILTTDDIIDSLNDARGAGLIDAGVVIVTLDRHVSRKRQNAYEFRLGCSYRKAFLPERVREGLLELGAHPNAIKRAGRRYNRQGKSLLNYDYAPYGATWFEWGHVIADLFKKDPQAIIGIYTDRDTFEYHTYERVVGVTATRDYVLGEYGNGRCFNFEELALSY